MVAGWVRGILRALSFLGGWVDRGADAGSGERTSIVFRVISLLAQR